MNGTVAQGLVLAGDIGGTRCRLAIAEVTGAGVVIHARAAYLNREAADLETLLARFLKDVPTPPVACLAVAGPTDGRRVALTNLAWQIDADTLAGRFGFARVRLMNDFAAVARGLDGLAEDGLVTLQAGVPIAVAPRAVLGPGTGLGVAIAVPDQGGYRPLAGEGGHIGLAPVDAEQMALLQFLHARLGRVSVERVLSGAGLVAVHAFCLDAAGRPPEPDRQPAEVSRAALASGDPIAGRALRLFCRVLGQTAGDLALVAQARAGVYLAGGIPPKILPAMRAGDCLAGFRDKGRFSAWMESVPLHVVVDPDIGLKGAALGAC